MWRYFPISDYYYLFLSANFITINVTVGAWGSRMGLLNCSVSIGATHTQGGNSAEEGRGRDKTFLGAPGGKEWLRR